MLNFYKQKNHLYDDTSNTPVGTTPKKAVDIRGFEDPIGGLGGKDFQWGVWYVKHRELLYKIFVGALGITAGGLIIWALVGWGTYLVFGWTNDINLGRQLSQFPNYTIYHPLISPPPLEVGATTIWEGGVSKYDLVTTITNSSDRFVATLEYYYMVNGTTTPRASASVLPGNTTPIVSYGIVDYPGSAELVIETIKWQRVPKTITDTVAWQAERLRLSVSNFSFVRAQTTEGANAHAVKFDLTNDSAYGYVEAQFNIGLTLGGTLVGIKPLKLDNFKSLESRTIDLRVFVSGTSADGVVVYPIMNVYDPEVYMPVE